METGIEHSVQREIGTPCVKLGNLPQALKDGWGFGWKTLIPSFSTPHLKSK